MLARDTLVSFLEYNYHADQQILHLLERLTAEQLHAQASISHATPFDLARHMLDAEWSWRLFALGGPGQQYLWEVEDVPDLPALLRFLPAERDRMLTYVRSLSDSDLGRVVDFGTAQGGAPKHATVWQILLHIVNHSTHHRSELSRCLEAAGHPIDEAEIDYMTFAASPEGAEAHSG
jgi:uncharacterized damage-inducible protein DinB